jgi:uncharacterized protein YebE (UPF0316 family)
MLETILGALLIMLMRIGDVSIGTMRTILVVQGRKYLAGMAGMVEVLIWVFAIRYIFQNLDEVLNLFGYAIGFGLGNIIGITLEQKIGLGFAQLNIISRTASEKIAESLRIEKYGVTVLPAQGVSGDLSLIMLIVPRKKQKKVIALIESIDPETFITVQHSLPYRGFIHGARK